MAKIEGKPPTFDVAYSLLDDDSTEVRLDIEDGGSRNSYALTSDAARELGQALIDQADEAEEAAE